MTMLNYFFDKMVKMDAYTWTINALCGGCLESSALSLWQHKLYLFWDQLRNDLLLLNQGLLLWAVRHLRSLPLYDLGGNFTDIAIFLLSLHHLPPPSLLMALRKLRSEFVSILKDTAFVQPEDEVTKCALQIKCFKTGLIMSQVTDVMLHTSLPFLLFMLSAHFIGLLDWFASSADCDACVTGDRMLCGSCQVTFFYCCFK